MANPFKIRGEVKLSSFCNRTEERRSIFLDMKNSQSVVLYSPRRYGKTWLIKVVLKSLAKEGVTGVYLDLFSVYSRQHFAEKYAREILKILSLTPQEMDKVCSEFFIRRNYQILLAANSSSSIEFTVTKDELSRFEEVVYDLPEVVAKKFKKKIFVVFDEFQDINRFDGREIEKLLRAFTQGHTRVGYIFAGSKRKLLLNMFSDARRPFYHSAKLMPLEKISDSAWKPFIKKLFTRDKLGIEGCLIEDILGFTEGHPFYTQLAFYLVWNLYSEKHKCSISTIEEQMLSYQNDDFANIWDTLTLSRQLLLIALAKDPTAHPFSGDYVLSHKLGSVSNIQEAIKYLERSDLIEKHQGLYRIVDTLFKQWILKRVI